MNCPERDRHREALETLLLVMREVLKHQGRVPDWETPDDGEYFQVVFEDLAARCDQAAKAYEAAIARALGMGRKTIRRWLRGGQFPERKPPHRRPPKVNQFAEYLQQRCVKWHWHSARR